MRKRLYLDYNATSPVSKQVLDAVLPYFHQSYQNPSSGYRSAKEIKGSVEASRNTLKRLLNANEHKITFTSGGTEANNTVLQSLNQLRESGEIITSSIEHSAVLRPLETLEKQGRRIFKLNCLPNGMIDLAQLESKLENHNSNAKIAFLSIMWVNNETGVIQPIEKISKLCAQNQIPLHVDACQAVGKIPLTLEQHPIDYLTFSSHKFGGLKGCGGIIRKNSCRLTPLMLGGGQEENLRSGTENIPAILSSSLALELHPPSTSSTTRDIFETEIKKNIPDLTINGESASRAPNTSNISIKNCESDALLILMDHYGIDVATGSACMTGKQHPSHVLLAMGVDYNLAKSSLRISFSPNHTIDDATFAADMLTKAVNKIRSVQSSQTGPVVIYRPQK